MSMHERQIVALERELVEAKAQGLTSDDLKEARAIVNEQAEDEALWCLDVPITEAYHQQELRRLHAAVEALLTRLTEEEGGIVSDRKQNIDYCERAKQAESLVKALRNDIERLEARR